MKIRTQVACTLGSIFFVVFAVMGIVLGKRLSEEASSRELKYAKDRIQVVQTLLDSQARSFLSLARQAAQMEDIQGIISKKREIASTSAVSRLSLQWLDVDGVVFLTKGGNPHHSQILSPSGAVPFFDLGQLLSRVRDVTGRPAGMDKAWVGLLALPGTPALVAVVPIPGKKEMQVGSLVLLRYFPEEKIAGLREFPVSFSTLPAAADDPGINRAVSVLLGGSSLLVEHEEGKGRGYGLLKDGTGKPLLVVSFPIPPGIQEAHRQEFLILAFWILTGFVVLLSTAFFSMRNLVFIPLEKLTNQLDCLISLGKHKERISLKGNTEIAQVGQQINDLLESLEETQQREKHASNRFEALVDNLPGVVYRSAVDDQWTKEYLSQAFLSLTGYETKAFLRSAGARIKSGINLIHVEDRKRVKEAIYQSRKEDRPFEIRYRIVRKDRRIRWVLDRGKVIYDPTTFAHWVDGFLLDVTEEVEAEKCLFTSEARYRDIFEKSPISLWIEDFTQVKEYLDQIKQTGIEDLETYFVDHPEALGQIVSLFKVVDVNQKTVQLFGATDKTDLLKGLGPIIGEGSHDLLKRELTAIFNGDCSFQGEGINYSCSGRSIHVFISWNVSPEVNGYERVLLSLEDITARKNLERQLRYTSHHDPLTGLNNRAFLEHQMAVLDMAQLGPLGVISIDVDGLKLVNDCLGHSEGDELLRRTGSVLSRSFRDSDYVGRVGGDEFNVILPRCDFQGLQRALQRLDQETKQERLDKNAPILLSLSVGWAFRTKGTPSLGTLFVEADQRMYSSKISNREAVHKQFREKIDDCIDEIDLRAGGREERLKTLIGVLSENMDLSREIRKNLELIARYHVLGRISFGPVDPLGSSYAGRDPNPESSERLALRWQDLAPVAPVLGSLSERWDGQGVPGKLSGEQIPLEARIFEPLRCLEEMAFGRNEGISGAFRAFEEIRKRAGSSYDPWVVEHLGSVFPTLQSLIEGTGFVPPGNFPVGKV